MPSTAFLVRFLRDHYCGHPLRGLGEWLGSQEKIFAKQKRQTGEYPSRAAGDLYRDAQQIIAWLQQWTGTPLRAPQRTPGSDVGTVLAELRAWCAKTARTVGNGAGANGEAPGTDPSTVEGSLTQAAEWLNMGPRRLKKRIEDGVITAVQRSDNRWVFDARQVLQINPKAKITKRRARGGRR